VIYYAGSNTWFFEYEFEIELELDLEIQDIDEDVQIKASYKYWTSVLIKTINLTN
jgi:hypothetical protein